MSQVYPLDSLIRRLDPADLPDRLEPEDHLVIFDAKARKVLPKKPLLSLGRDLRYFLVSVRRRSVECHGPICKLKSKSTRLSVELQVDYEARCQAGNEEKLVASLYHGEHPATALEEFIAGCIEDFSAETDPPNLDMCLDFPNIENDLRAYITRRAAQEIGATLSLVFRLQFEEKLQPIAIKTGFFSGRVRDCDQDIELKVATELEVDPAYKMRALLHHRRTPELEEAVRQTIRQTLAHEVTLHEFCYGLTGRVRDLLTGALDGRLMQEGRRIAYLRLESPLLSTLPPELAEIQHSVSCQIHDCEQLIRVEHRIQMSLSDLGRFRASGVQNLETWAKERLTRTTREVLFEKRYVELLLAFAPDEVKSRMQALSEEIGYTVKQLITIPNLEPLTWKDGISIENNEETYETHDSRVRVGLNVVVRGKINDLANHKLSRYLTPDSKLAVDMREVIKLEVQQIMHRIDPERFYMRFQFSGEGTEPPVRKEIEDHLGRVLHAQFALEDSIVTAKPLKTELTELLASLQQGPHPVDITCFPLNSDGEMVTYKIKFDIIGVDPNGWYTFWSKSGRPAEEMLRAIREEIVEAVRAKLQVAPRELRQCSGIQEQRLLEEIIHSAVRLKIVEVFGLSTSVVNVNRDPTGLESQVKEAEQYSNHKSLEAGRQVVDSKVEELGILQTLKNEMIKAGVETNDPNLEAIKASIEQLKADISPAQFGLSRQRFDALLPEGRSNLSLEEWLRLALQPPTYKQLQESRDEESR